MENKNIFKIKNADGVEVTYDVLFTFESNETKKKYIAYTDNSLDDKGNIKVYASVYEVENDNLKLTPVETKAEWDTIYDILVKATGNKDGANEQ